MDIQAAMEDYKKSSEDFGLPAERLFFSLTEIERFGIMSRERAKNLLYAGKINGVKNGKKWIIPRAELLRYLINNYNLTRASR
jgi:hypothetical protein